MNDGKKIKKIVYIGLPVLLILAISFLVFAGFNLKNLSGDSVTGKYYYCQDSSFELSGTKCKKVLVTSPYLIADTDHDNEITIDDVFIIQEYIVGKTKLDEFDLRLADVNKDGVVDNNDITLIQKYISISNINVSKGTSNLELEEAYKLGEDKLCPIDYKYDKEKDNCTFVKVSDAIKVDFIYGDINKDKKIDASDLKILKSYLAGEVKLTDEQLMIADINNDGNINIEDEKTLEEEVDKTKKASVILKVENTIDVNNVFLGDEITFQAIFNKEGNNKLYYKWYYAKSEDNLVESSCKVVENKSEDNYKVKLESESNYVILRTFSSSDCTQMVDEYKSDIIKASVKPNAVSVEYNIVDFEKSSVYFAQNTSVKFKSKFKVSENNKYYYKRLTYYNSDSTSKFKCTPIEDDLEEEFTLFINSDSQYIKWQIYSDSRCKTLFDSYDSNKYYSIAGFQIQSDIKKLLIGDTTQLSVSAGSKSKDIGDLVKWSSSDENIATVDSKGNVTAKKEGSVTIQAKLGNITSSILLTVVNEIVNFEYKLVNTNITSNIIDKNTVLKFKGKFEVKSNNKYYYMWYAIKDTLPYNSDIACRPIKDGMELNPQLTINGANQHGRWEIYSDSSCHNLVNSYETKYYNYYADEINMSTTSKQLSIGEKYKLNALVKTRIPDIQKLVKWTSSNVSIATVDENGNVTALKSGTAYITASIGGMSAKATIIVPQPGEDMSLNCPLIEYTKSGSKTNIKITPNANVSNYDVYFQIGSSYELYQKKITGAKTLSNYFKNKYSNQAKIIVYGKNDSSRVCYSAPITGSNSVSGISVMSSGFSNSNKTDTATCPSFSYDYKKSGNLYTYKDLNTNVTSGVAELTVKFKLNRNLQYHWYTSNKDGSYTLYKTYSTISNDVAPSVTGTWYERNGKVVVTDNSGGSVNCYTKLINNLKFNKTTYGGTDVYIENGYSGAGAIKNKVSSFNNNSPQYLPVGKIFAYTNSTYSKIGPGNSCGFISNRYVVVRDNNSGCERIGTLTHELGHGIDYMNGYVTSKLGKKYDLRDYVFNYNGRNTNITAYYSAYKSNYSARTSYLRNYAYTNNEEFWAELFAYSEKGFNTDSTLRNVRSKALDKYNALYRNNKNTWKSIKEQYR